MTYLPLIAIFALVGCSPSTGPNSYGATGSSNTPTEAPVASSESTTKQSPPSAGGSGIHTEDRIVGNWEQGDAVNAIYLVIKADGTFSTRDWDAL